MKNSNVLVTGRKYYTTFSPNKKRVTLYSIDGDGMVTGLYYGSLITFSENQILFE